MNANRLRNTNQTTNGSALVITLFFTVLITIIVIGFLESARFERSAASTHHERARAGTLAREGIEQIIATLRRETVDPPNTPLEKRRNWISQPGAVIVPADLPADQKQLRKVVPLSSEAPSTDFLARKDLPAILAPANLNIQTFVDRNPATYLISDRRNSAGLPATLNLRWVYVRADGKPELDNKGQPVEVPDTSNKLNPIVGRYAYWADDESSKINYNLAWKRDTPASLPANSNKAGLAHPSRINLMGLTTIDGTRLTESMADAIHNWTTVAPGRYFNSFADGRRVGSDVSQMLDYNKFELTHYNHDPDTTFFGEDRILLTTKKDLVPRNPDGTYARKFLDILRDDTIGPDPGILEDIAGGQPDWRADPSGKTFLPNKLDAVVRMMMRYISEKNWPLSPGVSFKDKYYPGTPDTDGRLGQIAVNILDYVRAKESPQKFIAPMRFAVGTNGKFTIDPPIAYGSANSYQGICRAPYITEMGMWMENAAGVPSPVPGGWPQDAAGKPVKLYKCFYKSEIFLPDRYLIKNGIDLVPDRSPIPSTGSLGWFILWTENHETAAGTCKYYTITPGGVCVQTNGHPTDSVRIMKADIEGGEGPEKTVLNSGKRVVITKIFYRDKSYAQRSTLNIRSAILYGASGKDGFLATPLNRWPRVNIGTQQGNISYNFSNPATTTINNMLSLETDDPRCNVHTTDWVLKKNTFGLINSVSTVGKTPAKSPPGSPQQDTDDKGLISNYSLYMPPPKGEGTNGIDKDNGRVTSIAELGYIHTGNNAKTGSTPWRTIRLQPNNYPASADPLKTPNTLPDWALMDLFGAPNTDSKTAQPIFTPHGTGIGGRINVNSHVEPFDRLTRDRGLVALLTGIPGMKTPAETVAANIYNRVLADGLNRGKTYGYPWKAIPAASDSNAFDTPGEICEVKGVSDFGESGEDVIREIASLVTARGSVFAVYTIGQALKQTPAGKLLLTAEQRQHVMIERYVENRGTVDSADDEVRFRPVYFRNLSP